MQKTKHLLFVLKAISNMSITNVSSHRNHIVFIYTAASLCFSKQVRLQFNAADQSRCRAIDRSIMRSDFPTVALGDVGLGWGICRRGAGMRFAGSLSSESQTIYTEQQSQNPCFRLGPKTT